MRQWCAKRGAHVASLLFCLRASSAPSQSVVCACVGVLRNRFLCFWSFFIDQWSLWIYLLVLRPSLMAQIFTGKVSAPAGSAWHTFGGAQSAWHSVNRCMLSLGRRGSGSVTHI